MHDSDNDFLKSLTIFVQEYPVLKVKKNFTMSDLNSRLLMKETNSPSSLLSDDLEIQKECNRFLDVFYKTTFNHDLLPYDKITECIFENVTEEVLTTFSEDFERYGNTFFKNLHKDHLYLPTEEQNILNKKERDFLKIMRHINLALVQKINIFTEKAEELKDLTNEIKDLKLELQTLKNEAESQNKSMLGQFISILGIFSAVLMGSFGAIQGFASLFENAHSLPLGKLLIISSVGGTSVILILFFLLHGIAKLTGKSLRNTSKNGSNNILDNYSYLFLIQGLLVFIALIGAALLLCNTKLYFSIYGLWWLLPLIWFGYFAWAFHKKTLLPFLKKIK